MIGSFAWECLPPAVRREAAGENIAEVRLRLGRVASVSYRQAGRMENRVLSYICTEDEMRAVFAAVCRGSVYAFEESVKEGYVTLSDGCRVGVAGRAVTADGQIRSLCAITALVFRFPRAVPHAADALISRFRARGEGILVVAPPGGGKTTVLREFAREISRGDHPRRVAVIDARGEFAGLGKECTADVLSGYPCARGIEIATRTLCPEVLVTDEIGEREALTLRATENAGVPVVASAHGSRARDVRTRPGIAALLKDSMFSELYFPQTGEFCPATEGDAP